MNTLLPCLSVGADALDFNVKEETFVISSGWQNGLWRELLPQNEKSSASHCPCLNSECPTPSISLEIKFFKEPWLLHKFLLPLKKIPNMPNFLVKDTIIYIFLWGVMNIWFQKNV